MRLLVPSLVLVALGCAHDPATAGPPPPPQQPLRMLSHFAWPGLTDTRVQVHQRSVLNGHSTETAQGLFRLTHAVQPGFGTVSLAQYGEPDPALEVKPFTVEVSRDGRLLTLPPARAPGLKDDKPYSHSPQFLWNLWVALWNPLDMTEGQTIELPNDVEDEALGRLHFTATITGLGYVRCQAAPSGWCQRLTAKFRPDAASVLALFAAVVDEKKQRPGEIFEPRRVEYELEILSEPETMLPHRLDMAFHVEVLAGPPRTTSLVRFEQKTTMQFWHLQRIPVAPPSGPQREPPPKAPLPNEQVRRPAALPGNG